MNNQCQQPCRGECETCETCPFYTCSNDQPPPIKNDNDPVWPQAIEASKDFFSFDISCLGMNSATADKLVSLMQERHEVGIARYGTPLQTHNGRDFLEDALQEVLDAIVYTYGAYLERGHISIKDDFHDLLAIAIRMIERIGKER